MLDERSAFVERKDETHDPNGLAISVKDLLKALKRRYYLFVFIYFAVCSELRAAAEA